jgi:hypothetical protein
MNKPLWRCGECGRTFANPNQTHTCAGLRDLAAHFVNRESRPLFDAFADAVRGCGPVEILPEKTRIAFHVRMSFAQITPRRNYLLGHFVFARRVEHPRFRKIETISARNHVHHFRIDSAGDIDAQFREWIAEAYAVGEQRHIS